MLGMSQKPYGPGCPSSPFINSPNQHLVRVCSVPSTLCGIGDALENDTDFTYCPSGVCVLIGETGRNQPPTSQPVIYAFPFQQVGCTQAGRQWEPQDPTLEKSEPCFGLHQARNEPLLDLEALITVRPLLPTARES